MSSGIKMAQEAIDEYKKLKDNHQYAALFLELNKTQTAIEVCEEVDTIGTDEHDSDHEENCFGKIEYDACVVNYLKYKCFNEFEKIPLFVMVDLYQQKAADQAGNNKVICFSSVPENCSVKLKMIHASTTEAVKKSLGVDKFFEIHDESDLDDVLRGSYYPCLEQKVQQKPKVKDFSMKAKNKLHPGIKKSN